MEVYRALLAHFREVMKPDTFKQQFTVLALEMRPFLERTIKTDILVTKRIYEIIMKKAETCSMSVEKSIFAKIPDPVLEEMATEQVRQILWASLSVKIYGYKYQ